MSNLDKIPSRVKYYLLEYRDRNMEDYQSQYGTKRMKDLTTSELLEYFILANKKDVQKMSLLIADVQKKELAKASVIKCCNLHCEDATDGTSVYCEFHASM